MLDPFDLAVGKIEFITDRVSTARWRVDDCAYPDRCVLAYAFSGRAHYRAGESFTVEEGDVLFFKPGQRHSARSDPRDPWHFCSVCFQPLPLTPGAEEALARIPTLLRADASLPVKKRFTDLASVWNAAGEGDLLYCRSLISSVLSMAARASTLSSPARDPRIDEAVAYLSRQSETVSIETLAARAGLSPSHFRALFKEKTGQSVLQFQNDRKIRRACDLLKSGGANVSEIAAVLGFSSVYYFSRLFKEKMGVSPSDYARRAFHD
ncbi:MAG: helix-turn-helix domain-containing protein [Clostridia bacterium]|nr:helix-turn-helix domain-containing protein [Clostridia bacterium]